MLIKAEVKWRGKKIKGKKAILSQFFILLFFFSQVFISRLDKFNFQTGESKKTERKKLSFYVNKQVLNDFLRAHKFTFT